MLKSGVNRRKLYKLRHKDKVNAQRRRRYAQRRAEAVGLKECGRCGEYLEKEKHAIKYCTTCKTTYEKYLRYFWPSRRKEELQSSEIELPERNVSDRVKELWAIASDL